MAEGNSARDEILARIRRSTPDNIDDTRLIQEWMGIRRAFHRRGALDPEDRLQMFEDRLQDYGAGVFHSSEAGLPKTIASALQARGKHRMVVPPELPQSWLPTSADLPGLEILKDEQLNYDALDRSDGVITGCTLAIAFTGTIILQSGPHEGRRAITLVPDYHVCIVRVDQIVELVPEGLERLRTHGTGPITFFSGPSATADIEMTRIQGVHGPRVLDAVIVV